MVGGFFLFSLAIWVCYNQVAGIDLQWTLQRHWQHWAQDAGRRQTNKKHNTTETTKNMSNTEPPKSISEVYPCAREG